MKLSGMVQNFVSKTTQVKNIVRHPFTQQTMRHVFVEGKGWFAWNGKSYLNESKSPLMAFDMHKVNYGAKPKITENASGVTKTDFDRAAGSISEAHEVLTKLGKKCVSEGRGDLSIDLKHIAEAVRDASKSVQQIATQKVK